jgi:hypothetical protein
MQFIPEPSVVEAAKTIEEGETNVQINVGGGVAGAVYSGSILIFGGAGLLLAYMLNKKKENK